MKRTKLLSLLLAGLMAMSAFGVFGGCGNKSTESVDHGDVNANREVPSDSITLEIGQESDGRQVRLFGAQMDPHFLSGCVGRELTKPDGTTVKIERSEWENVTLPRLREMGITYIRMMALPSWWAKEEVCYTEKKYTWDSLPMQDIYLICDAARELGIDICFTVWLWDCKYARYPGYDWDDNSRNWCLPDPDGGNTVMAEVVADCLKYLIEEKGYTNIKYFTPVNEPNSTFGYPYPATGLAYGAYDEMCREIDRVFKEKGIRDKLKFNLGDSSTGDGGTWFESTAESLYADGVADIVNTHWYNYDESCTNKKLQDPDVLTSPARCISIAKEYNAPVAFGEYGAYINNEDNATRAYDLVKIAANMWHDGAVGMSYWRLQSDMWNWDRDNPDASPYFLGLWKSADGDYACRPSYYTYSLMTRFIKNGMDIYNIEMSDDDVVAVAFRKGDQWTYLIVNDSKTETKKFSFLNNTKFPASLEKYTYEVNAAPTDNKAIPSSGSVTPNGRVLTDSIAPHSIIVYSNV